MKTKEQVSKECSEERLSTFKMFLYGLLSKKFIIAILICLPWIVMILLGVIYYFIGLSHKSNDLWDGASKFNAVISGVMIAFMGADLMQNWLPRKGASGLQQVALHEKQAKDINRSIEDRIKEEERTPSEVL